MPSIMEQNSRGRLDIALMRVGELMVRRGLEPRVGMELWEQAGVGQLCERFIVDVLRVPSKPVDLVDAARVLGWLPPAPKPPRVLLGGQ